MDEMSSPDDAGEKFGRPEIKLRQQEGAPEPLNIKDAVASSNVIDADFKSVIGNMKSDGPRQTAEKLLQLWEKDPAKTTAMMSEARGRQSGSDRFDKASLIFYDIKDLSGPENDLQKGRNNYDKIQAETKAAYAEKLNTPESRKKATEHLANAAEINESEAGNRAIADRAVEKEKYTTLESLGKILGFNKYGEAAPEVLADSKLVRAMQRHESLENKGSLSFDEAYGKLPEIKKLTSEAKNLLASGREEESVAALTKSMELSFGGTEHLIAPNDRDCPPALKAAFQRADVERIKPLKFEERRINHLSVQKNYGLLEQQMDYRKFLTMPQVQPGMSVSPEMLDKIIEQLKK